MKINVVITGSTGMVGKGVLLECLDNSQIESVLVINRESVGIRHPKLKEIIHRNFSDLAAIRSQLTGYNACFFCLGISSAGLSEKVYSEITFDLTVHFARNLAELNPDMTFCYISGAGTDSSEKGRVMWARVKGRTENALLNMGFKAAYMFRPGLIKPMRGIRSKTGLYNAVYVIIRPLFPLLKSIPGMITDTDMLTRALIYVTASGYNKKVLETRDINLAGGL
jgi:hypothetical protein